MTARGDSYLLRTVLIVALGGFLMGFDASVISGAVGFIEREFALSKLELGWAVASLTLTATIAIVFAGPLADRLGRRTVLQFAAVVFAVSALVSAIAGDFTTLMVARLLSGFGVGAALVVAPMYIAEISPPEARGRMVTFYQLNVVIGIAAAFFSNYLILQLGKIDLPIFAILRLGDWSWRWMLGIGALPASIYFFALLAVPESPRWLAMQGDGAAARNILIKAIGDRGQVEFDAILRALGAQERPAGDPRELLRSRYRLVLGIGLTIAVLQQITGINAVFYYAPMIFARAGAGADVAFAQAAWVGLVNLVFTVLAMLIIDRVGRRPLLMYGVAGVAVSLLLLSFGFSSDGVEHPRLVLAGVFGFVASFAASLGPVMYVLLSEIFPNQTRGLAISLCGLVNSTVSFLVQLVFPWELENFGNSRTFLIYGAFAVVGLVMLWKVLPETRGRSLEELEARLVGQRPTS